MKPVNEDSAARFLARFYNASGDEHTPATAQWALRDVTNDRELQPWTSITVSGTTHTLEIPASLHSIYDDRKQYQEHALSIQTDVGLSTQYTSEIQYRVKNLRVARR